MAVINRVVSLRCDGRDYASLANLYAAAGARAPIAVRRAVQRKGRKALTHVRRSTGQLLKLPLKLIRPNLTGRMTGPASYTILARGTIPLRHFKTVQTAQGVVVRHIPRDWVIGHEKLGIAFQGKTGKPKNQPGNAGKRLASLGGAIVYGTGARRREGIKRVKGVALPEAFIDHRTQAEFDRVAQELPKELAHQLWVVVEGFDTRAAAGRVARGGYRR